MKVVEVPEEISDLLQIRLWLAHLGWKRELFTANQGKGVLLEELPDLFFLLLNNLFIDQDQFPPIVELVSLVDWILLLVSGVVVVLDNEVSSEISGDWEFRNDGLASEDGETSELIQRVNFGVGRAVDLGLDSDVLGDARGGESGDGVGVRFVFVERGKLGGLFERRVLKVAEVLEDFYIGLSIVQNVDI